LADALSAFYFRVRGVILHDLVRNGVTTKGGRVRSAVSKYLEIFDRFDKVAQRLGLERDAREAMSLAARLAAAPLTTETDANDVRARWSTTCAGRPFGRSSARACRDRLPCRSSGTRPSRSIAATLSWMRPCNGKRQHASMPGWLFLRQH